MTLTTGCQLTSLVRLHILPALVKEHSTWFYKLVLTCIHFYSLPTHKRIKNFTFVIYPISCLTCFQKQKLEERLEGSSLSTNQCCDLHDPKVL